MNLENSVYYSVLRILYNQEINLFSNLNQDEDGSKVL